MNLKPVITVLFLAIALVNGNEGDPYHVLTDQLHKSFANPFLIPVKAPICPRANYIDCSEWMHYRTSDGTCNNLDFKWYGAAGTPLQRLLQNAYADGVDTPRQVNEVNHNPLPNPFRTVFTMNTMNSNESKTNNIFLFFGDFIAHDYSKTAKLDDDDCECDSKDPDACINLYVNPTLNVTLNPHHLTETVLAAWLNLFNNETCEGFARSIDIANTHFPCNFKTREQFNIVTHWLDMSQIYGASEEESNRARKFEKGLLEFGEAPGADGMPALPVYNVTQCGKRKAQNCYWSPDHRTEDYTMRVCIATIMLREHNRIAGQLLYLNPHWSDERVYQEARRLTIAVYQKFIYADFLPLLLGPNLMTKFKLNVLDKGYLFDYNKNVYPNVFNEFTTAAFRLHNFVDERQLNADENLCKTRNNPMIIYYFGAVFGHRFLHSRVNGMFLTKATRNAYEVADAINFEYNSNFPDRGVKESIPAYNIQRGRDHGLQAYVKYVNLIQGGQVHEFSDLLNISPDIQQTLEDLYVNVNGIDLWLGMSAEESAPNSKVGDTQGFIIAKQFHDSKYGDRFYFENGDDEETRFTLGQLRQIRMYSFSTFLCKNLNIVKVPVDPFALVNGDRAECTSNSTNEEEVEETELVNCADLPDIDFSYWREASVDYRYYD